MEVSEAKRKRELEAENRKLKELVADLSLEDKVLKEIVSKNYLIPSEYGSVKYFSHI
jgi:putative transposase